MHCYWQQTCVQHLRKIGSMEGGQQLIVKLDPDWQATNKVEKKKCVNRVRLPLEESKRVFWSQFKSF